MEKVTQTASQCNPAAFLNNAIVSPELNQTNGIWSFRKSNQFSPNSLGSKSRESITKCTLSGGYDNCLHSHNSVVNDPLFSKFIHCVPAFNALSKSKDKPPRRNVAAHSTLETCKLVSEIVWNVQQGLREEMEDVISVEQNEKNGLVYAAIFDGHAGSESAYYLKDELYKECMNSLKEGEILKKENVTLAEQALKEAFSNTDSKLLSWLEEQEEGKRESGSTAVIALIMGNKIHVAYVGDSRAVLCRDGDSEELSSDHRPHGGSDMAMSEIERVKKAGGWISHGRVCGALAVSRAFGDIMFKTQRKQMLTNGFKKGRYTKRFIDKLKLDDEWVSSTPDFHFSQFSDDCDFVLLASDGLWDSVKSSEACRFVKRQMDQHGNAQLACDNLADFALKERKGEDNLSIILITLK